MQSVGVYRQRHSSYSTVRTTTTTTTTTTTATTTRHNTTQHYFTALQVYFSFHGQVRLRFNLATGLGEPWCREGGIPQGCPLSMVFTVALYVPWCRHLESLPDVKPQLYADNLKCSAERPRALFESARFTARYVRSIGQDVSCGECVLLSTSKYARKAMKLWDVAGDGDFWKVQLDVRDLGGHLDFTCRARAGPLSNRVRDATLEVASVGSLPLGFQVKLGLVRGKYLPAGLHAAEASFVSSSSVSAFRAANVRAVWSSKMPLADAPAILNLLDGPVGVDPAFHIIWSRFRMMRRYLAYCPEEEPRIFRMLDLISRESSGSRSRSSSAYLCCWSWVLLGMEMKRVGFGFPSLLFV